MGITSSPVLVVQNPNYFEDICRNLATLVTEWFWWKKKPYTFPIFLGCHSTKLAARKEDPWKEPGNFGDPLGLNMYDRDMRNRDGPGVAPTSQRGVPFNAPEKRQGTIQMPVEFGSSFFFVWIASFSSISIPKWPIWVFLKSWKIPSRHYGFQYWSSMTTGWCKGAPWLRKAPYYPWFTIH